MGKGKVLPVSEKIDRARELSHGSGRWGVSRAVKRLPNQPIELTGEQMVEVEVIVDKLEDDDDDVQVVFTNLA